MNALAALDGTLVNVATAVIGSPLGLAVRGAAYPSGSRPWRTLLEVAARLRRRPRAHRAVP